MNQLMTPSNAESIVRNGIRENVCQPILDIIAPKSWFGGSIVLTGKYGERILKDITNEDLQKEVAKQIAKEFTAVNDWQSLYASSSNDNTNMAKVAYVTNYLLALYRTIRFNDTNCSIDDRTAESVAQFISSVLKDLHQQNFINDNELSNIILGIPGTANHYINPNLKNDSETIRIILRGITIRENHIANYNNLPEQDLTPSFQLQGSSQQVNSQNPQQQGYWQNGQWYQGQPIQQQFYQQPVQTVVQQIPNQNFPQQGGGYSLTQQQTQPTSECCNEGETMEDLNHQLLKAKAQLEPLKPIDIIIHEEKPKDPAIYDDIYQGVTSKVQTWLDEYIKRIGDDKDQIITKQTETIYDEEVAKHSAKELSPALSKESGDQKRKIIQNVQKFIEIKYDYVNHFFENSIKYLAIGDLKDGEKSKKLKTDIENATQLFRSGKKGDAKRAMQTILKESENEETKGFFYSLGKFLGSVFSSDGYDIDEVLKNARKVDSELFDKWKILDIERSDVEQLALLPDDKKPKEFMHKAKHRKYTNYYWDNDHIQRTLQDTQFTQNDKIEFLGNCIHKLKEVEKYYNDQIQELIFQYKGDGKNLFSTNEALFGKIKFGEDGEFDEEAPSAIKDIFTVGVSGTSMYVPIPSIITDIRNSISNVFIHPIQEAIDYRDVRVAWVDSIKSKLPDIGKVEDLRMITDFEIIATLAGGHNGFYKDFKNTSSGGDMKAIINMIFAYSAVTFPEPVKDLEAFIDKLSLQYGYDGDNLIQIYKQTKKEARDILMARATNIIHDRVGLDKLITTKKTLSNLAYERNEPVNSISYSEQKIESVFSPIANQSKYSNNELNNLVAEDVKTELDDYVNKRIKLLESYGFKLNDVRVSINGNNSDINLHPNLAENSINTIINRIINNQDGGVAFQYRKASNAGQNADANTDQAIKDFMENNLKNTFYDNNGKLKDEYTIEQYREAVNAMNELKPDNLNKHLQKWGRENFGKLTSKAVKTKIPLEGNGTVILASKPNVDIELPADCVNKDGMIYGDKLYDFLNKTQKGLGFANLTHGAVIEPPVNGDMEMIKALKPELVDEIANALYNQISNAQGFDLANFNMANVTQSGTILSQTFINSIANFAGVRNSVFGGGSVDGHGMNDVTSLAILNAISNVGRQYQNNNIVQILLNNMMKNWDVNNLPANTTQQDIENRAKNALKGAMKEFTKNTMGLVQKGGKYYINPGNGNVENKLCYVQTRDLKDCETVDEAVLFLKKLKDGYILESRDGKGHSNQCLRNYIINATDSELKSLIYVMAEDKSCPSIGSELRKSLETTKPYTVMGYDNTNENERKDSIENIKRRMDVLTKREELKNVKEYRNVGNYNPYNKHTANEYKEWSYEVDKNTKNKPHEKREPSVPIIG